MKRLWLVRLGKHGEFESRALENKVLTIGFGLKGDVSHLTDRDKLIEEMARILPNDKPQKQKNFAAQVNQFLNVAQTGDLVVSPFKTTSTIAIGRIDGPHQPGPDGEVTRPVEWLKTDLLRISANSPGCFG